MYSLDINFLKDRPDYVTANKPTTRAAAQSMSPETRIPLFIGGGVGVILLAAVGGFWLFLQHQGNELQQQQAELEQKLGSLKGVDEKVKQINDEINTVTGETKALAGVFNQIKPWSAMLQDMRISIPKGVQIDTITQKTGPMPPPRPAPVASPSASPAGSGSPSPAASGSPSPSPAAATPVASQTPLLPPIQLVITGFANSFSEVNDFVLTLQKSQFFKNNETQLVSAKLIDNPTIVELPKLANSQANATKLANSQANAEVKLPEVKLPKVVSYTIQTTLSDLTASDLLRELDRKGAVGLVTRIKTLQNKGVIQP
jgi:type IV pilus assembly protein PilN